MGIGQSHRQVGFGLKLIDTDNASHVSMSMGQIWILSYLKVTHCGLFDTHLENESVWIPQSPGILFIVERLYVLEN